MPSSTGQEAQRFDYYPSGQAQQEAHLVRQRRGEATAPGLDDTASRGTIAGSKGLALSGGGIRSATFNLGLLQSLAADRQLKEFDFLSTVSGGGYIGACLGRLYQRSVDEHKLVTKVEPTAAQTANDVEQILASDEAPLIRWLRDHGRYLAPQGMKDRLFAFGIYLRNMLTVHVLLGMLLLYFLLSWALLRDVLTQLLSGPWYEGKFIKPLIASGYSPAWLFAAIAAMATLGCAWAYWMHRHPPGPDQKDGWKYLCDAGRQQRVVALAFFLASAFALYQQQDKPELPTMLVWTGLLWTLAIAAPFALLFSSLASPGKAPANNMPHSSSGATDSDSAARRAAIRNRLTIWLRNTLLILLGLILFALLDEATQRAYSDSKLSGGLLLAGGTLLAGLRSLVEGMAAAQTGRRQHAGATRWIKPVVNALGIVLLCSVIGFWSLISASLAADLQESLDLPVWMSVPWRIMLVLLILLALTWLSGKHLDVLNLSSLHHFYAARLARAYLGAGNAARGVPWSAHPVRTRLRRVEEVIRGDDMKWDRYCPHEHGGPLHLLNINVNQTRFFTNSDFQPDRQGWNLAIGPAGFNLGRSVWRGRDWKDKEDLRLSQWIAASGAAFTTGAGARTGLGFSALLGLLGVRLGYWWRAGAPEPDSQHEKHPAPQALRMLWSEITGSFNPDEDRHWYLSDGGHFENCAAYELIRRRLKRIVVADCGADPQYELEDLANLVLKVRIDFGVELILLGARELDQVWQGQPELRSLFADPGRMHDRNGPGLLLATVRYPADPEHYPGDTEPGWMVIIKPRLPEQLPKDLEYYAGNETRFPQQSTLDQFYDEAQWESTRKLGRLQGEQLARVLKAWPAWQNLDHATNLTIGAAPLPRDGDESADPPPASEPGAGNALKIYAPIFVALWTAFEFYSNYQQQAARQADEARQKQEQKAAETMRLVLSRIDQMESQVFGRGGCKGRLEDCPSIPTHVRLTLDLASSLQPPSGNSVVEILKYIEKSIGAGPADTDAARTGSATKSPPTSPPEQESIQTQVQHAWVYVQIYAEERRPAAVAFIQRLRGAGMTPDRTPGIENVTRTAQAKGQKTPASFNSSTVIYFHAEDQALAAWIGSQIDPDSKTNYRLLDLSGKVPNVRSGQIEVWLP